MRQVGYFAAWLAAVAAIVALSLLVFLNAIARAHGTAEWIQRGEYKNSLGELCCGERDCFEMFDADVKITPQGYVIRATGETSPFHEATPSPTGTYWRCYWGGKRKCFFAPPGST